MMHSTSQTSASAMSMVFETVCVQQKKVRNVPGLPLLGTYLRKANALIRKMLEPLFTAAKIYKQHECPSTEA